MTDNLKKKKAEFDDLPVGEILKRTREHYRQSVFDVEKNIRIREYLITAIEENDIEQLPARVYTIGFVRSYAEYLGLDSDKIVAKFKEQAGEKKEVEPELFIPQDEEIRYSPPFWLVVLSVVSVIVIAANSALQWSEERREIETIQSVSGELRESVDEMGGIEPAEHKAEKENSAQEVVETKIPETPPAPAKKPEEIEVEPQPTQVIEEEVTPTEVTEPEQPGAIVAKIPVEEEVVDTLSEDEDAEKRVMIIPPVKPKEIIRQKVEPKAPNSGIVLVVDKSTWVEVKTKEGESYISKVLKEGDQYFVPDHPDLYLTLGNAVGVRIKLNGTMLRPLGRDSKVIRNLPLTEDYLERRFAP